MHIYRVEFFSLLTLLRLLSVATRAAKTPAAPCEIVSASWTAALAVAPSATPTVAASLALDCLNSVPLHSEEALELVDQLRPYLEWQSDSAYIKDPPSDYFYSGFDIFDKLDSLKSNLENGAYSNEYGFQEDLFQMTAKVHNGHFSYYVDLFTKVFEFGRQVALVSISSDGNEIPEIYVYQDVVSSPETASVLIEINGIDAATYVATWMYIASVCQDPDAGYNAMFYSPASEASGAGGGSFKEKGRTRYLYPGTNTTFGFANGTVITLDNVANVKGNFTDVTDGESCYYKFCRGGKSSSTSADVILIYPAPVISTKMNEVSGHYLEGEGFEEVAVMSLLSFASYSPVEYQTVIQDFFARAVAAGKTKLVIDLCMNGGGYAYQGYDLFRQLFPDIVQEDYHRFREQEYLLSIARIISDSSKDFYPSPYANDYGSFNWRYDFNLTEQPFTSFEAKFDPHSYKGDNFSAILRWNITSPYTVNNITFNVTGYGVRTNFTQPFLAENIVMLQDGFCGSTCALFDAFMKQGGVKTIAMGGRPNREPIQGVGGVKGWESSNYDHIIEFAKTAINLTNNSAQIALLKNFTALPINRSSSTGVNFKDFILPGNLEDGIPAQYVVEEADCRLYYTLDMILNVTALWKGAANAAWNGKPCIAGEGFEKSGRRRTRRDSKKRSGLDVRKEFLARRDVFLTMEKAMRDNPEMRTRFGSQVID